MMAWHRMSGWRMSMRVPGGIMLCWDWGNIRKLNFLLDRIRFMEWGHLSFSVPTYGGENNGTGTLIDEDHETCHAGDIFPFCADSDGAAAGFYFSGDAGFHAGQQKAFSDCNRGEGEI